MQHLQGALQLVLHLQMTSSGKSFEIVGVVVYTGVGGLSGESCCHPQRDGETAVWCFTSLLPHTCPL